MAERRMFSKTVTNSARFLMMPASARLLYYDLGMAADDDGIVEAFVVMRLSGADKSDLETLESKGYIKVLNDELVTHILDWKKNNFVRSDRYQPSIYSDLLAEENCSNSRLTDGIPSDIPLEYHRYTQDRVGKDRLGKDRLGEGRENGTHPLTESEKEILVSEGISESYIEEREHRAYDYALSHKRAPMSVMREWWASDKDKYAAPSACSFEIDDFFEAAVAKSMQMLQAEFPETG